MIPRVVAEIRFDGTMTLTALSNYANTGNPRGATSTDGNSIWLTGSTGGTVYTTVGSTTVTTIDATNANERRLFVYNGQLYVSAGSPTLRVGSVGTGTPTTGPQTTTPFPGIPALPGQTGSTGDPNSPYGFFLTHLSTGPGDTSTTSNTLYVAQEGVSFVGGSVEKFTLVGSTWVETGSVVEDSSNEDRDLTGVLNPDGSVTLYIALGTAAGGNGGGFLATFTDTSGYNGTMTGSDTNPSLSIPTVEGFRGVSLCPAGGALRSTIVTDRTARLPPCPSRHTSPAT